MDVDSPETRYRSRILREMKANRENPFNSPPSSTGSHGTLDPTITSVYTDMDGDSTRKINEDIARITGNKERKAAVDWDAIHKKWPEFYPQPKELPNNTRKTSAMRPFNKNNASSAPASPPSESKENRPPKPTLMKKHISLDDFTLDSFDGSNRTRAEMQPRVESDNDTMSTQNQTTDPYTLAPPAMPGRMPHQPQNRSPLAREHTRSPSTPDGSPTPLRRMSMPAALHRLNNNTADASPQKVQRKLNFAQHVLSKEVKAATKQQKKQTGRLQAKTTTPAASQRKRQTEDTTQQDVDTMGNTTRSFFLPDITNLGDFVSGRLEFKGTVRDGVPILVKNGKVVNVLEEQRQSKNHAAVDGFKVPEDEERMFVSMDVIRDEIVALQEHDDMVQEYADGLELEVEELQAQIDILKSKNGHTINLEKQSGEQASVNEVLLDEKKKLEEDVVVLRCQLQEANKKTELLTERNEKLEQEKQTAVNDRERAMKKFQTACENLNQLENQLDTNTKELRVTQKQLDATLEIRDTEDGTMHTEFRRLKDTHRKLKTDHEALKREVSSLRDENEDLRNETEALRKENQSLRSTSRQVSAENGELRRSIDSAKSEISAARIELERQQKVIETLQSERNMYRQDNDGLTRNNDKYYSDNKTLKLQASKFERNLHDLAEDKDKLRHEVEFLKTQLEHMRQSAIRRGNLTVQNPMDSTGSGFYVDDHTPQTEDHTVPVDTTRTFDRRMPIDPQQDHLGTQTMDLTGEASYTREFTHNNAQYEEVLPDDEDESLDIRPATAARLAKQGHSVKFDVPDATASSDQENMHNTASQRLKRRSSLKSTGPLIPQPDSSNNQDTGTASAGFDSNDTENLTLHLEGKNKRSSGADEATRDMTKNRSQKIKSALHGLTEELSNLSFSPGPAREPRNLDEQFSQRLDLHNGEDFSLHSVSRPQPSRNSTRNLTRDVTSTGRVVDATSDMCTGLSVDARKVLDDLCQHECRNCTVCSRIATHKQVITQADVASNKKHVTVPRPVPVSERDHAQATTTRTMEDPTARPSQPPGDALALVIKALEDESEHLNMELSALQVQYNALDKSAGKRERKEIASKLKGLLKKLEGKNDQIYALYDVLEGQKMVGQMMSEAEMEMTIMSITGMNLAEVDMSREVTWDTRR